MEKRDNEIFMKLPGSIYLVMLFRATTSASVTGSERFGSTLGTL